MHASAVGSKEKLLVVCPLWNDGDDPVELQPLGGKAVAETLELAILEHAIDLPTEHFGLTQFSGGRKVKQRLIGNAAPEKKGEPRREVVIIPALVSALPEIEKPGRTDDPGRHILHSSGKPSPRGQLLVHIGGVAIERGLVDRPAEGSGQEAAEPCLHGRAGSLLRLEEKRFPDAAALGVEVRTVDDRPAELEKGLHQKRRERKVITAVVEAVFGAEILRKRCHPGEPRFDELRLAQRTAPHPDLRLHLARLGLEVAVVAHHFLRQGKDLDLELKQVLHGVVVLEAVHAPNGGPRHGLLRSNGLAQDHLQLGHDLLTSCSRQRRGLLRRHLAGIERLDHLTQQLRLLHELGGALEFQQVHLPLHL